MWRGLILELKQTDHPQFIQWAYETLNSQKWLVLTWLVAILIGTFCAMKCSMDVKGSSWNHKEHLFLRMHNSLFLISVYTHCICDLYTLNQRNCCEIYFIRFNLIFHKLSLLGRIFIVKKVHVVPWNKQQHKKYYSFNLERLFKTNTNTNESIKSNWMIFLSNCKELVQSVCNPSYSIITVM